MRISDWSSDVCSSDLVDPRSRLDQRQRVRNAGHRAKDHGIVLRQRLGKVGGDEIFILRDQYAAILQCSFRHLPPPSSRSGTWPGNPPRSRERRSEEHTSELQSLMRISYAVICLKKKRHYKKKTTKQKKQTQKKKKKQNDHKD